MILGVMTCLIMMLICPYVGDDAGKKANMMPLGNSIKSGLWWNQATLTCVMRPHMAVQRRLLQVGAALNASFCRQHEYVPVNGQDSENLSGWTSQKKAIQTKATWSTVRSRSLL